MHIKSANSPYYCCGICQKGVCEQNDDSLLIANEVVTSGEHSASPHGNFFVAVADGVSNSENGRLASKKTLELLSASKLSSRKNLKKLTCDIHEKVRKLSQKLKLSSNMQTTLCAMHVDKSGRIRCINVGDSRLYRFHSNTLTQITKDQSFVEMLYETGKISHEQKRIHSNRNLVLTVIGSNDISIEPEIINISDNFELGDIYLICSDGLSDYVFDSDIENIMNQPMPLNRRIRLLYQSAMANGSNDNISIVALTKIK